MRNPYVIGAYVTDRKYYGRQALIEYLLHGAGPAYWVVGNRRIGKTSLLRQLELLARADNRLIPLWWDMQGCANFKQLGAYLADAVREYPDPFLDLGMTAESLDNEDALVLLPRLRRVVRKAGREILLLCDETEVLIKVAQAAPKSMQRFHHELTGGNGLRVVATSTQAIYQLHDVCRNWPTSPFLAGFDMSQTLGSLSQADARCLVMQAQEVESVRVEPEVVDAICEYTNQHPYLIQLLCSRLFQPSGRLRMPTVDDLQVDPGLRGFLAVDFYLLAQADRVLISAVHSAGLAFEESLSQQLKMPGAELHQRIHNLERLGYLRHVYGQVAIGNQFLSNWLAVEGPALTAQPAPISDGAMRTALDGRQVHEANYLRSQLNAHRARLIELEAVRARDLLAVSPQILAEIEQHHYHIRHLRRSAEEYAGEIRWNAEPHGES